MAGSDDLIRNFQFTVSLGGEITAFQEVILPESEIEVLEYRNGSDVYSSTRKIPGLVKYSNLILKRGLIKSPELHGWFKQAKQGIPERKDITVSILNEEHEPFVIWKLRNCWPVKYSGPTLSAKGNEVAIETLEIATEDVDVETV